LCSVFVDPTIMGDVLSVRPNQRDYNRQLQPIDELLMYKWKSNDLLYEHVKAKRQILQDRKMGNTQRLVAKYSSCKVRY